MQIILVARPTSKSQQTSRPATLRRHIGSAGQRYASSAPPCRNVLRAREVEPVAAPLCQEAVLGSIGMGPLGILLVTAVIPTVT